MDILGHIGGASELDLIMLTDDQLSGFFGELAKISKNPSPQQRKEIEKASQKLSTAIAKKNGIVVQNRPQDSKDMTAKALIEKRLEYLPEEIRLRLLSGDYTVTDFSIASTKLATTKTEMFLSGDTKEAGITNIDNAKVPNNMAMLVTSIILLSGTGAGATKDDGKIVDFKTIEKVIANGTCTFKNGEKTFFERMSNEVFKRGETGGRNIGEVVLETPKILMPNTDIIFELDLPSGFAANTFVKVILKGVITNKA